MTRKKVPDYETALAELEQLVERLEHGGLPLEQSLKDFERGVELTRLCQNALQQAEQKVELLISEHGREELTPLPDDE